MKKTITLCASLMAVGVSPAWAESQTDEAAAVFGGTATNRLNSRAWKVVYANAEGPQLKALEVLTERLGPTLLRNGHTSTAQVLPLERAGDGVCTDAAHAIIVGVPGENAALSRYVRAGDVPKGGYLVKGAHEDGHNVVVIAGAGACETLWATFDFLDVCVPDAERRMAGPAGRYAGTFFRGGKIPAFSRKTAPETPVRSVFSWGHVQDDYEETFRAMARARFNRVLLWNDKQVVNAREVVACAHDWGVKVFWGFSWGWTLSGSPCKTIDLDALAGEIVRQWQQTWRPMGGDGVYFQSFTETKNETIGGRPIPEAVTTLVNDVTRRIRAEEPKLEIVFGLHSNSMRRKGAAEALARLDPTVEVLWENCGGFPYWEGGAKPATVDTAFHDQLQRATPNYGLAWKAQLRMDWANYIAPAGPFLLGRAGKALLARDRRIAAQVQASYDEDWLANGKVAYDLVRSLRASGRPPRELNAVAEYNPPYAYSTQCQAELFWNSRDGWDEISRRARLRTRAASER